MKIHSTAIVSPSATLGENTEVGPYSIIGEGVVIGANCKIESHAVIETGTTIGDGNSIGHGAVIGAPPQDFAHTPDIRSYVKIGNDNRIREHVTIHRGTKEGTTTSVGNRCFLMVGSHLAHNVELGNEVILTNNVLLGGHVTVGDGAILGGGSVFHQFIRVGCKAMVSGGSRFSKDIVPYAVAEGTNRLCGVNMIGLRRSGFSSDVRAEIRRAYHAVFDQQVPLREAVALAIKEEWGEPSKHLFDFILSSKRGCATIRVVRGQTSSLEE